MDARTGIGVPFLRITTDNGIVCYTRLDGQVTWAESSLMSRGVHFEVSDESNRFVSADATLRVTHGGRAELTVQRRR